MRLLIPALLLSLLSAATLSADAPNDTGALPDSAASSVPDATIPDPRLSIAAYLQTTGDHDILLRAVGLIPNLASTLSEPATRFTVFAPVDNAFVNLARSLAGGQDFDQNDKDEVLIALQTGLARLRELESADYVQLRTVINYHVIGQALPYGALERKEAVTTTQGDDLRFADGVIIDGDESRGNATAGPKNIFALNGWVNVVYEILLPFNLQRAIADADAAEIPMPSPSVFPSSSASPGPIVTPEPGSGDVPVTVPGGDDDAASDDGDEEIVGATGEDGDSAGVTPEETAEDDDPVCFPASASVSLSDGSTVRMDALAAGHSVRVSAGGEMSRVFLFTHRSATRAARFYRLTTASGHSVALTGGHYVHVDGRLVAARAVRVGDVLTTESGASQVVRVQVEMGEGLFAPHTVHGDLMVDGVRVSGYSTAVHPKVAHALLAPVRMVAEYVGVVEPLGGLFYEGADGLVGVLPKGRQRH